MVKSTFPTVVKSWSQEPVLSKNKTKPKTNIWIKVYIYPPNSKMLKMVSNCFCDLALAHHFWHSFQTHENHLRTEIKVFFPEQASLILNHTQNTDAQKLVHVGCQWFQCIFGTQTCTYLFIHLANWFLLLGFYLNLVLEHIQIIYLLCVKLMALSAPWGNMPGIFALTSSTVLHFKISVSSTAWFLVRLLQEFYEH